MDQIDNPTDEQLKLIAQIKKSNDKKAKPKKAQQQYPKQKKQDNPHRQIGFDKQAVQHIQYAVNTKKEKSKQQKQLFQLIGLEI